jgi:hypothetical protein
VLEVDERARGPEPLPQFLARDEITRSLQQQGEDVEGLSRQAEAHAGLAELTGVEIQLEHAELDDVRARSCRLAHRSSL